MTNAAWFKDFDTRLMTDEAPSVYFIALADRGEFPQQHPFDWLLQLRNVQQNQSYHPEGNVWKHTMLVVDGAADYRSKSRDARALMWAALLHDLGKIPATKMRRGRWTAYDHDKMGRGMAEEFLRECGCDAALTERVGILVRWHMQPLFVAKNMPFADLEGMMLEADIDEVGLLALADRLGRGRTDRETVDEETGHVDTFIKKSRAFAKRKQNV